MQVQRSGEVAVLRLNAGKANAIGPGFLRQLNDLLDQVADARAVVLIGTGKAWSAGLDLPSLVGLDRPAMRDFMRVFGDTMLRVLTLPVPVVAAINGHAIAGGCVLTLMADVRWMAAGTARIGLNETQLGLGLPAEVIEPLRLRLPASSWLPIALEGGLHLPQDALRLGLVDAVVDAADLEAGAVARAAELGKIPQAGFAQVKAALLRPTLQACAQQREAEQERWLDTWFGPAAQERVRQAVAKLGQR